MAAYRRVMTHVTCGLTAKNWDQLWNPVLSNRVWTIGLPFYTLHWTISIGQNAAVGTACLIYADQTDAVAFAFLFSRLTENYIGIQTVCDVENAVRC